VISINLCFDAEHMKQNKFQHLDLKNEDSHHSVISIFVSEFKKPQTDNGECLSISLLQDFFELLSFDFTQLLISSKLTPTQTTRFVSYVLYAIYYYEIPITGLATFNKPEHVEYFLLALMAESLDSHKIETILQEFSYGGLRAKRGLMVDSEKADDEICDDALALARAEEQSASDALSESTIRPLFARKLPFAKQLHLASYCAVFIREGTWTLFNLLADTYPHDHLWNQLFSFLRSKYYDSSFLNALLSNYTYETTPSLQFLIDALEKLATAQILKITQILPNLVRTINLSDTHKHITQFNVSISNEPENLENLFAKYSTEIYFFEEMQQFFQIFGLKGHVLTDSIINNPMANATLDDLLQALLTLFQNPVKTAEEEQRILFVLNLCHQLHVFNKEPSIYAQGLENLVFALPTKGLGLTERPWLKSVLEGLKAIESHLKKKKCIDASFKMSPVVIFDQSSEFDFKKNESYINHLTQEYAVCIFHFSIEQTLELARLLGLESWINHPMPNHFGHGGDRNCVFLLAPIIAKAYFEGKKLPEEVLALDREKLRSYYENAVLGKNGEDLCIHIGEDDVAIQSGNIFSDAFFAKTCHKFYFDRSTECYGRETQSIYPLLDLKNLLQAPSVCFFKRTKLLSKDGMKSVLTKPRFCLPIFTGNEEFHVIPTHAIISDFRQGNYQFRGTQFPTKDIPKSPLDGIEEILEEQIPYRFNIAMISMLTDSKNVFSRCIYPWNDEIIRKSEVIHTLGELWEYSSTPAIIQMLKQRFWNNFEALLDARNTQLPFRQILTSLSHVDLEGNLYQNGKEKTAPGSLREFYKIMKQEAHIVEDFAKTLLAYRAAGDLNFIEQAKIEVENKYKKDLSKARLAKSLLELITCIEGFGKAPLY
jgi:hypothetical protein